MPVNTTVLLVEDHVPLREKIAETLKRAGYHVLIAADGNTGLQLALEHHPHLILCDIMLPKKNGYQVFTAIRQNPETAHIPFIFMTEDRNTSKFAHQHNSGNFITKPIRDNDLLALVKARLQEDLSGPKTDQEKTEHIEALEFILSSISHELRNPICSSLGLASLLDYNLGKKTDPDEIKRIVEGIKANAARLDDITTTLTDVVYQALQNYKQKVA